MSDQVSVLFWTKWKYSPHINMESFSSVYLSKLFFASLVMDYRSGAKCWHTGGKSCVLMILQRCMPPSVVNTTWELNMNKSLIWLKFQSQHLNTFTILFHVLSHVVSLKKTDGSFAALTRIGGIIGVGKRFLWIIVSAATFLVAFSSDIFKHWNITTAFLIKLVVFIKWMCWV